MKEIDNEKVGKFIENLRKEKGLTQQDLADILSVSNQAVSKWEGGRNLPDIAIQRVICDTFNITMEELHAGERDIKKRNKTKKIRKENKIFSIALMCIVPVMVFFVVYFIINFRALKIYYSNSQITNEENSIRANLLIFKLPRKLIIFINNIYPCNYEVKDSDLLDLKLYSGNKKLLNSSMIKNDIFEIDALTFDPNNVKLILNIESVTGEKRKFQREVKLVKYTSNDRNDDKYKNKSLRILSNDEIVKKLLKDGYINTENEVYEKKIDKDNSLLRIKYDLEHENIEILYLHNSYTEKIVIDYQVKIFQTVVFNNNNIDNISEKYIFDLKTEKNICEIGECATLKNTRKMVEKYLSQLQVG
jgi:transcriptional regulator with XRE-family HTH domain